jgi:hypothetical protein
MMIDFPQRGKSQGNRTQNVRVFLEPSFTQPRDIEPGECGSRNGFFSVSSRCSHRYVIVFIIKRDRRVDDLGIRYSIQGCFRFILSGCFAEGHPFRSCGFHVSRTRIIDSCAVRRGAFCLSSRYRLRLARGQSALPLGLRSFLLISKE